MSKLSAEDKFLDLSDYGRIPARYFAQSISNTFITPVHVTLLFGICGAASVFCILNGIYLPAAILLILKSVIDAADGELSRINNSPSYTGRYLDSIFDILINFAVLAAIAFQSSESYFIALLAFFAIQLQGTLFNYYYVILRNNSEGGDSTSKIFEDKTPEAIGGESQVIVDILFKLYKLLYGVFDNIIYNIDYDAHRVKTFPKTFMTFVSMFGLGFHLLIMAVMLSLGLISYICITLIVFSLPMIGIIAYRKVKLKP